MKNIFTFTLILMALTACSVFQVQKSESAATGLPPNMPNPATVYCVENGNQIENHTAEDGSQSSECVFPDGSTCDEWAYFRGECGPAKQESPTPPPTVEPDSEDITDWWGVIRSTDKGAQFDVYFERQDLGQIISYGIDSMDPEIKSRIEAVRDSGKIVHLYGKLLSDAPDYNGLQVQVERIYVEEQASGGYMPPGTKEEIADWRGVIKSTDAGAQYDDYFELWTNGQIIYFGIDAMDPAVKSQIEAVRDTGKIVLLYGTLFSNVPDYNGSQILVKRIEVEG